MRKNNILIPLTCIRYYSKKDKKVRKDVEVSLTQFLGQSMIIMSEAIKNQKLTGRSGKDILDCFQRGCYYLFANDEETRTEVQQMLEPYFKLEREIWQEETEERLREEIAKQVTEEVTERITEEVTKEVTEDMTAGAIEKLIRSLKDFGGTRENVKKKVMKEYELSETDAEEKMKQYF